jgi:5-formyltetrahydrofolate cyclo-ligase
MIERAGRDDRPEPVVLTKEGLRRQFSHFRETLDEAGYAARSQAIVERLQELPEVQAAARIHLYWPMLRAREVDIRSLAGWLHAQKKQIVLPIIRTFGRKGGRWPRMEPVSYSGTGGLRANKWGIFEPSDGETVPVEDLDLVIVPALGAGRNGHRIGHGYGYYDEFLRDLRHVPRIGPVYHECLVEAVPAEEHDVPLTVIVTEREVVRPAGL